MPKKNNGFQILVIDDDELVRNFIVSLGEDNGWRIEKAENGPQGIDMVKKNSKRYQIALLDIRMPGPSGLEVLPQLLKYGENLAVLMMSGFAEVDTAVEAMKNGAFDLVQKPIEPDVLVTRIEKAAEQRQIRIEHSLYVTDIEKRVAERTTELEAARKATIFGLARLAEYRDEETGFHLERMANYTVALARALREKGLYRDNLTDNYLGLLFESAPLHDIGKVGIPDKILHKPDKLTPEEFEIIKTHTTIGANTLEDTRKKVTGQTFLTIGIEVALSHHEHYDGRGYPQGLKGDSIPLPARILALADFYDALSFPRVYRPFSFPHEKVREMIEEKAKTQFDPDIVKGFLKCECEFVSLREEYQD